ncbi:type II toxin-antitoxin system VapC family toxin [Ornithinimicrobium cryptoxanthini]|uniref:Ribonuclease VapC n=1 Tax=Ornithinimicrobium cryptoxanthini TaxID=2934161 RepID=A0ABY4YGC2_9MICO|nr:type II toxin-antitoxin system VapC family toxin [Ornithinimicrobium cryptoxanthini]USQ75677.1 type II toxin-antitoxin system VapC family toxin [Ornithinimicrobium cryptoxanthini]
MILDTSALVAILTDEEDSEVLLNLAVESAHLRMSAATALEASIVLDSRSSPQQRRRLDDLLAALAVEIVPFDATHWALAREAYRDFGRGSGHPARFNMGDCYAYALHRATGEPLLYVGDDFAAAGVPRAAP